MASKILSFTKQKLFFLQKIYSKQQTGLCSPRLLSDIPNDDKNGFEQLTTNNGEIKKTVFISQSYDVYTNLALEDWIYTNFNLANHHVLMLWANNPTVVIGKHQNPFLEANIKNLKKNNIEFARRSSGGGTVYHDRGNLNCTFFTPRDRYNRKYNLNLISRALYREWGIKADISDRDDILLNGKKLSGTAAKLGHKNAYHHCTILVNANKMHLSDALANEEKYIISNATKSIRSPIINLCDVNRHVNVPQLLSAVGYEFLRTMAVELNDGGRDLLMKQSGFQLINPTERWFPGITKTQELFQSWDWCFGRTPEFSIVKDIKLKSNHIVKLKIIIKKGIIDNITLSLKETEEMSVVSNMIGKQFAEDSLQNIELSLKDASADNVQRAIGL